VQNPPEPVEYFWGIIRVDIYPDYLWYEYTHKWNYPKGSGRTTRRGAGQRIPPRGRRARFKIARACLNPRRGGDSNLHLCFAGVGSASRLWRIPRTLMLRIERFGAGGASKLSTAVVIPPLLDLRKPTSPPQGAGGSSPPRPAGQVNAHSSFFTPPKKTQTLVQSSSALFAQQKML
jgi:hypothetical protein